MRTLVNLPEKQIKVLNMLSKQRKVSRAQLVREAVATFIDTNSKAARKAALDAAFGLWKDREIDGLEYQKKMRAEWDRR
jgi:metal-responsive CopG/Arc/MetJ family transcriptional regulator